MTPEVAVRTRLLQDATVGVLVGAALVGVAWQGRIYHRNEAPQYSSALPIADQYPMVTYFRASARPGSTTHDRRVTGPRPRIQLDLYSTSQAETDALYEAVMGALQGEVWMTADGDRVQRVDHAGDNDVSDDPDTELEPGLNLARRSADFIVTFRKAG